jgi:hypothetical protein
VILCHDFEGQIREVSDEEIAKLAEQYNALVMHVNALTRAGIAIMLSQSYPNVQY